MPLVNLHTSLEPYIAIKTIEGNWVNESEITITVNLNYVDH